MDGLSERGVTGEVVLIVVVGLRVVEMVGLGGIELGGSAGFTEIKAFEAKIT